MIAIRMVSSKWAAKLSGNRQRDVMHRSWYIVRMAVDGKPVKGRGAAGQPANRFLRQSYGIVEWEGIDVPLEDERATRFLVEHPKTIVNKVSSPDLPFTHSLNPYQGCEHGCAYCYARPTHEYWGYSAGLDFEQVILVKRNAAELLRKALRHPRWDAEPITISGATDPYQPIERKEGLTRAVLEVALEFKQPVALITKNALILRDLDLLSELAFQGLAHAAVSLTTLDEGLRRAMEPRTSTGAQRLRAISELRAAGVPVMAMIAPIIPALNEPEVPSLLKASAEAGALTASYTVLRANGSVAPVFSAWLHAHFPERAAKVLEQLRDMHGGEVGDLRPGRRMRGEGPFAESIRRMFTVMRRRYFGEGEMPRLRRDLFMRPAEGQLDLFA